MILFFVKLRPLTKVQAHSVYIICCMKISADMYGRFDDQFIHQVMQILALKPNQVHCFLPIVCILLDQCGGWLGVQERL
jgi:hypothetical protein